MAICPLAPLAGGPPDRLGHGGDTQHAAGDDGYIDGAGHSIGPDRPVAGAYHAVHCRRLPARPGITPRSYVRRGGPS